MNEIMTMRTDLANQFAAAGAKLLDFTMTAGALAAIPNTTPQQYAVAGTLESIRAVLPKGEPSHPQRRLRHGDRPSADSLSWEGTDTPAATSGEAPTAELAKLKELASDWPQKWWYGAFQITDGIATDEAVNFIAAASPAVVLDLIARIERAAAPAPSEKKAYGPDNPPRLRKDGESVQDYRIAMGWDEPPTASPATASGDELPQKGWLDAPSHYSESESRAWARGWESARAAVSAATKPTTENDLLVRLYARHTAWAERSGHAPMGWEEFKADRMENPLTAAAIERSKKPAYGVARTISSTDAATKPTADLPPTFLRDDTEHGVEYYKASDVQSLLATKPAGVPIAWGLLDIQEPELTNDEQLAAYWARKGRKVTALYAAPTAAPADQATLTRAECDAALRWLDVTRLYAFVEPEDEALEEKLNKIRAL